MFSFDQVEEVKSNSNLKPGINIPVKFQKAELAESGDLDLYFVGADVNNAGSFKPRYWANNLDPNDEKYKEWKEKAVKEQLMQILSAFMDKKDIQKISGNSVAEWFNNIAIALNTAKTDIGTKIKIIYSGTEEKNVMFPNYGSVISTEFFPRGLSLSDKKNDSGIPYDRVLPMSEYGVSPDEDDDVISINESEDAPF